MKTFLLTMIFMAFCQCTLDTAKPDFDFIEMWQQNVEVHGNEIRGVRVTVTLSDTQRIDFYYNGVYRNSTYGICNARHIGSSSFQAGGEFKCLVDGKYSETLIFE